MFQCNGRLDLYLLLSLFIDLLSFVFIVETLFVSGFGSRLVGGRQSRKGADPLCPEYYEGGRYGA
jgi:hypothetical protein